MPELIVEPQPVAVNELPACRGRGRLAVRTHTVIATELAQKFVDRFCSTIGYNVNVMDTDGTIIAARDTHRIGTYHEVAHALVVQSEEAAVVLPDAVLPAGVLPGVNLPVRHRGEVVGVIGVTGSSRDVGNLAHAVRTAIETMLEYEWEREQLEHRQDRKKFLIDLLLYKEDSDPAQVAGLAERCGYDPRLPRMPIVLELPESVGPHDYLRAVKLSPQHTRQDLSFVGASGHVTVFKVVPDCSGGILQLIRQALTDYCAALDDECRSARLDLPARYATGPVQDELPKYRSALRTAHWILHRGSDRIAFYADHAHDLLLHSIAPDTWHTVFDYLLDRMRRSGVPGSVTLEQLGRTFMVLREQNMSPKHAAERLGLHRNTVVFRLNRINDLCGLDPTRNWRHREMLYLFFDHLARRSSPGEIPAAGPAAAPQPATAPSQTPPQPASPTTPPPTAPDLA